MPSSEASKTSQDTAEAATAQGVLVSQVSPTRVRLVTHLDVDAAGIDRAAAVLTELLAR